MKIRKVERKRNINEGKERRKDPETESQGKVLQANGRMLIGVLSAC